jgi:hypothetical protein
VTEDGIKNAIKNYKYNDTQHNPINVVLDDIQLHLKCCGAIEPADWQQNVHFNQTIFFPSSCCGEKNETALCTDPVKNGKHDHNLSIV